MKQISSKIKYVFSLFLMVFIFVGFFPKTAEAKTPLHRHSGVEVMNKDAVIDGKYTFIPKFTNQSSLEVYNGFWRDTVWASWEDTPYKTFNVKERDNGSRKNQAYVKYRNIGRYRGKNVDLKITIKNWELKKESTKNGNISFEKRAIGVSTSGFEWVDMDWQFYEAGTNNLLTVDGYFTISDIDLRQGVDLSPGTYNSFGGMYINSDWNQLWYQKLSDGFHRVSTDYRGDVIDPKVKEDHAFTFTFSNNSFRFRWFTNWNGRDPESYTYGDPLKYAIGEYFEYTDVKPARFDVTPSKRVNHRVLKYPIAADQKLVYNVDFDIPNETRETFYENFTLTDTVDSSLNIESVRIIDRYTGDNMNSRFNISTNGRRVTAVAMSNALSKNSFYNMNYSMEITTSIDTSKLDNIFSNRSVNNHDIRNGVYLTINNKTTRTNEVTTRIEAPVYYELEILHKDEKTGRLIASNSMEILEGEPYYEVSRTDLKRGIYNYKPLNPRVQSGTMYRDMTLTFWYRVPKLTVENKGIHIYTDKSGDSQPVDIFLDSSIEGGIKGPQDTINDFAGGKVELSITDTTNERVVWSEEKRINWVSNNNKYSFKIPNNLLGKNAKTDYKYELKVTNRGLHGYELITSQETTTTHGYTSSEEVLKGKGGEGPIRGKWVVLTEATPTSEVKEYWEHVTVEKIDQPRLKSGYGYELNPKVSYKLEEASRVASRVKRPTNTNPFMDIDERIVDLSDDYIDSHMKNNFVPITLDVDNDSDSTGIRDISYKLPRGYLSREDGRIRYSGGERNVDAGNKMYVPVWIKELRDDYKATLRHTTKIGSNLIGLEIENDVDVYAYMLNHTDSETQELDELLLHPMNQDDELFGNFK